MTTPNERTKAVLQTYRFLLDLINPSVTPGVPVKIRERASSLLKNFPRTVDIDRSAVELPDIWGEIK